MYYVQRHISQYDGSRYAYSNCTPASGANGVAAVTHGRIIKTGAQIRALVPRSAETNPATPGWSLEDLDHAMSRLGIGFDIRSGSGWATLVQLRKTGHYIALQGDSDRFSDNTCSGKFNGDHCIGVHPRTNAAGLWWIDDPICGAGRWESAAVLRAYAQKLSTTIRFGSFHTPVPQV